jgi:hypothetical protein
MYSHVSCQEALDITENKNPFKDMLLGIYFIFFCIFDTFFYIDPTDSYIQNRKDNIKSGEKILCALSEPSVE